MACTDDLLSSFAEEFYGLVLCLEVTFQDQLSSVALKELCDLIRQKKPYFLELSLGDELRDGFEDALARSGEGVED